jgi:hypothetical protein
MDGPNAEVLAELEVSPDLSRPLISYVEDAARLDLKDTELGPDMEHKRAAVRIFEVCGACPHAASVFKLAGEEVQACEWMHRDTGAFTSSIGKVSARPSLSDKR